MLSPVNVFPYIYKAKYDFNFESIQDRVDKHLQQAAVETELQGHDTLERDGGITSVVLSRTDPPHSWEEMNNFKEWLYKHVEEVWEEWRLAPCMKELTDSWMNIHPPGAYTAEHHHQNVQVAVSCYLSVPENSGRFMIQNPLNIYKLGEPLNYYYWDEEMDWIPVDVETNDVLFFPGWLKHRTEVNNSEENRYIMSLNIMGNLHA